MLHIHAVPGCDETEIASRMCVPDTFRHGMHGARWAKIPWLIAVGIAGNPLDHDEP